MKNLLLYVSMLLFMSIGTLFAQTYSGGAGTAENPYQISTLEDLRYLSEEGEADWDKHFIMTNDIDASDTKNWNLDSNFKKSYWFDEEPDSLMGFQPIAFDSLLPFTGVFDGDSYIIDNLFICRTNMVVGFIGFAIDSEIKNLQLTNCSFTTWDKIDPTSFRDIHLQPAAGLVLYNYGNISNCKISGHIKRLGSTSDGKLSGFVLYNYGEIVNSCSNYCMIDAFHFATGFVYANNGTISNCFSNGYTTSESYETSPYSNCSKSSGFAMYNNGEITQSYSLNLVESACTSSGFIYQNNTNGLIHNCFLRGIVAGGAYDTHATLAGFCNTNNGTIRNCYTANEFIKLLEGGNSSYSIIPFGTGKTEKCFFDQDVAGIAGGKTTFEMQDINTFLVADWDFDNIWAINENINGGYPYLKDNPVAIIETQTSEIIIQIYPNPASSQITIVNCGNIDNVEIYNISGILVITSKTNCIDISELPNGTYHIVVRSKNKIQTNQLIIAR